MNEQTLANFLIKAKKATYAAGGGDSKTKENNHSTTLIFQEDALEYHDNYFGGEPYGGREVVFENGYPVWMMVYYGWVEAGYSEVEKVYTILQQALSAIPHEAPFRGPKLVTLENMIYKNNWQGDLENFFGEEKIMQNDTIIYQAKYMGGWVDQK